VIDAALRPEGWAPKPGSRVVILARPGAPADEPPPPPGVWVVIDRAPEPRAWWVMPHDGEAKVWAVVARAGRTGGMPAGWPGQQVPSTRLFPAGLVQKALPGC
jgi:anti-sigma factor RsiW